MQTRRPALAPLVEGAAPMRARLRGLFSMTARATLELVPMLASLLIAGPAWALEPCYAVSGDFLRCGKDRVRVRGLHAPHGADPGAEEARARLQRVVMSGRVRLEPRARDRYARIVADLYVNEVRILQRHVGGDLRAPIDATSCRVIDGDTLNCAGEPVRIRGVYAAERGQKGGQAARERLARVIASGVLKLVRRATDGYGRTIADAYVDGRRIRQKDIGARRGTGSAARIVQ